MSTLIARLMSPRVSSIVLGVAVWAVVARPWAAVLGGLVAAFLPLGLERLEPGSARRQREALERDAADVAEILALLMSAGATIERATAIALRSATGPTAQELARTHAALQRGAGAQAWTDLGQRVPSWSGFTSPLARALISGAPVADVLMARAATARRADRDAAITRARRLGIRATVPLGIFILPSFVVLAVIPLVASLGSALLPSF
jgi:Flp pilus assembly protein TadB